MTSISHILKVTKRNYAEEFVYKGGMFLRRISEFRKFENDTQGDKSENLSYILQEKDCLEFRLNGVEQKLSGSLKVWPENDPFIFCMYAIFQDDLPHPNQRYHLDSRCSLFGDTIVLIKDGLEFINRINSYCDKAKVSMQCGIVNYYDELNFSGPLTAFDKKRELSYQQEYRFSFDFDGLGLTKKIFIGNISDIVEII
ncbi:hypothetical protein [Desulfoluna butyratoxydans]|uniref:Uncharacterized protein n=1 Tax=Desulfoluna butyratoxydans TaxID=231438 RepID=A0A4U8YRS5_9BACT|nr:hypothetical protein [Desulfoluna butyratoxydans]VFQ47026.1 hypothetical protein MSL71_47090 [Desulfoluna butyratoxydans]